MSKSSFLILLIVALALAGCAAATGPLFQQASSPEPGKALIYIYRPNSFVLSARTAYLHVNAKKVADLSTEGYTKILLEPGTYKLRQTWPFDLVGFRDLELPLVVEASKTYYYRFQSFAGGRAECPSGGFCYAWSLRQVTAADAMPEISQCRFQAAIADGG